MQLMKIVPAVSNQSETEQTQFREFTTTKKKKKRGRKISTDLILHTRKVSSKLAPTNKHVMQCFCIN